MNTIKQLLEEKKFPIYCFRVINRNLNGPRKLEYYKRKITGEALDSEYKDEYMVEDLEDKRTAYVSGFVLSGEDFSLTQK